jgi:hypothetical protein
MTNSWEFALRQATGDYITYLSDDDAFHPRLLSTAWRALGETNDDMVVWPIGGRYFHDTFGDAAMRNTYVTWIDPASYQRIPPRSITTQTVLNQVFRGQFSHWLPRMYNILAARQVFEDVRRRLGRVFLPINPDYNSGMAILSVRNQMTVISDAVSIWGVGGESIGWDLVLRRREVVLKHLEEIPADEQPPFSRTPMKAPTVYNTIADGILQMKELLDLSEHTLDWVTYYREMYRELVALKSHGYDVGRELEEFEVALGNESTELQREVRTCLHSRATRQTSLFRRAASSLLRRTGSLFGMPQCGTTTAVILRGSEHSFSNIFECSQVVDALISKQVGRVAPI